MGKDDDNPFAPPPEGTPDRPWQPRRPSEDPSGGSSGNDSDRPDGSDGSDGSGRNSPWGSQWSDRQPGRSQGGFGERPGRRDNSGQDDAGKSGSGGGPRWDPTDPAQRRARYALLSGMWAFFFALFGWRYVALLLGALALSWAIQSLRAKPRTPDPTAPAPAQGGTGQRAAASTTRPQTTAAISGLVTGALALLMVAGTFTAQLVYQDYYTCVDDALTNTSQQACEDLLPEQLRPLLGEQD